MTRVGIIRLAPSAEQALALRLRRFRHQREGPRLPHVGIQFPPGVGNARRETLLVNRPQGFEIRAPEIRQGKFHAAHCSRRARRAITLSARGVQKSAYAHVGPIFMPRREIHFLLSRCRPTYHSHQRILWIVGF